MALVYVLAIPGAVYIMMDNAPLWATFAMVATLALVFLGGPAVATRWHANVDRSTN